MATRLGALEGASRVRVWTGFADSRWEVPTAWVCLEALSSSSRCPATDEPFVTPTLRTPTLGQVPRYSHTLPSLSLPGASMIIIKQSLVALCPSSTCALGLRVKGAGVWPVLTALSILAGPFFLISTAWTRDCLFPRLNDAVILEGQVLPKKAREEGTGSYRRSRVGTVGKDPSSSHGDLIWGAGEGDKALSGPSTWPEAVSACARC